MYPYTYSIKVHTLNTDKTHDYHSTLTGTVTADRIGQAYTAAWQEIHRQCFIIRQSTGKETAVSSLSVDRADQPVMR